MNKVIYLSLIFLNTGVLIASELKPTFNFKENTEIHHVKIDETLARIALKNKVSVAFLLYLNKNISNPDKIYAGQKIQVPNTKAVNHILSLSKEFKPLIVKMGAMKYKERKEAIEEMIQKDWIAIPLLLQALKSQDIEIRENAKEALKEIHRKKEKLFK